MDFKAQAESVIRRDDRMVFYLDEPLVTFIAKAHAKDFVAEVQAKLVELLTEAHATGAQATWLALTPWLEHKGGCDSWCQTPGHEACESGCPDRPCTCGLSAAFLDGVLPAPPGEGTGA